MQYEFELKTGLKAVCQAARICRKVQQGISPSQLDKKDKSPVTIADFASQIVVSQALKMAFPNDPIIGEEDSNDLQAETQAPFRGEIRQLAQMVGVSLDDDQMYALLDRCSTDEHCPRYWTVDPIDGTKGFLRKEQYAISLGLVVEGKVVLGILGCPNLPVSGVEPDTTGGQLYWGIAGVGAYRQSFTSAETGGASTEFPVTVSKSNSAEHSRFCESVESGHSSHGWSDHVATEMGITSAPVRLDSQAKYAIVARGDAEAYLRLPTRVGYVEKIWDHAGGVGVIEAAGGQVTDIHGKPLEFCHGRGLKANQGVVVSNGAFHAQLIEAITKHAPAE